MKITLGGLVPVAALACFCGCISTPSQSRSRTEIVHNDSISEEGSGIGSYEIRAVASQMAPKILALPEIAQSDEAARIAIAPMRNRSSYPMDMNVFMTRLRSELSQYGNGKVRFFAQGKEAQEQRGAVLKEKTDEEREQMLNAVADAIARLPVLREAEKPPVLAVTPALNANLVNLNADSFVAMLRAKISERGGGKIRFTMPGELQGADYYLTGQFIADSMKREGIVNLVDYISLMEERMTSGLSLDVYDTRKEVNVDSHLTGTTINVLTTDRRASLLDEIQRSATLREVPGVTKKLNVMLVETSSRTSVFEKMFDVDRQVNMGFARAAYILSGEVTSVSKRVDGREVSYIMVNVQLLDPETNEFVWEDIFEIKKASQLGVVY